MTVTKVVNSETYRWSYLIFDVAKINADIELKVLNGVSVVLSRATIEWYAEVILGLTGGAQPFPQIGKINTHYARQLAAPRADEPIVLAQLRRSQSDFSNDLNAGLDVPGTLYYDPCSLQILKPSSGLNEGQSTGEAILATAASQGCDLLIKGAYTQSRLRQMIFGGATRHILANATLPVLMAH